MGFLHFLKERMYEYNGFNTTSIITPVYKGNGIAFFPSTLTYFHSILSSCIVYMLSFIWPLSSVEDEERILYY